MRQLPFVLLAVAALAGCVVAPAGTARQACDLLQIASDEAQMAEAWYLEAGKVLHACGQRDAMERAQVRACYARRFNDAAVVCE